MRRVTVIVLLSIATVAAADKDKARFTPGPASSYPTHQTLDKITIAAVPYLTDAETATAFGKLNPNKYGVLPVLVILENETGKALRLGLWRVQWCPVGRHFDLVRLVKEADLSPAELEFAAEHHDITVP